jgi:hypothetical protein
MILYFDYVLSVKIKKRFGFKLVFVESFGDGGSNVVPGHKDDTA